MKVEGDEKGKRTIRLICPSVSKTVQISAWDDQKLDLGLIAQAFGLNPNTLKLNGHFISRGLDFIASSVTWKSLIGFFSFRGLSTGVNDSNGLLVDGNFSKIGSKRLHCVEDGNVNVKEQGYSRESKRPQHEHCSLLNKEQDKGSNSGQSRWCNEPNGSILKRKWLLGDESDLKRIKSNESFAGNQEREAGISTNNPFPCNSISKTMKRTRDNEMVVVSSPLKKIRWPQ
ncbi:hypothetical protein CASFOL_022849 [Castilleja foliolosa]|uniref:Uncharacterized protein n=1 Tax=Castilleja foliolosa TaxID=1961234 RepID=A0ABD3CV26_9LAMI